MHENCTDFQLAQELGAIDAILLEHFPFRWIQFLATKEKLHD
jgi:hypothetical protein